MKLTESRGIKTGLWFSNEILRSDDINFVGQSTYQNLVDQVAAQNDTQLRAGRNVIFGLSLFWSTARTALLQPGIAVSPQGEYLSGGAWGFSSDPDGIFGAIVPVETAVAFDAGGTYDRVDVLEIRPIEVPYDEKSRQFKDPVTEAISSSLTNTKKEYDFEFAIRKGDDTKPIANEKWTWTIDSATVGSDLAGKYLLFSTPTDDYYAWFDTGSSTDPAVAGRTGVQVEIQAAWNYALIMGELFNETFSLIQSTNEEGRVGGDPFGDGILTVYLIGYESVTEATNGDVGAFFDPIVIDSKANGPSLQTDGWVKVAEVYVAAGASVIAQGDIRDPRGQTGWLLEADSLYHFTETDNWLITRGGTEGREALTRGYRYPRDGARLWPFNTPGSLRRTVDGEDVFTGAGETNLGLRPVRFGGGVGASIGSRPGTLTGDIGIKMTENWSMDFYLKLNQLPSSDTDLMSWAYERPFYTFDPRQVISTGTYSTTKSDITFLTSSLAVAIVDNGNPIRAIAGTLSAGTFTWGTPATMDASNGFSTVYDCEVHTLDATHFLMMVSGSENATGDGITSARVGSVSGTTITFGNEVVIDRAGAPAQCRAAAAVLTSTKFLVISNALGGRGFIGTISGTTITMGSAYTTGSNRIHFGACRISDTTFAVTYVTVGGSWSVRYGSESAGVITWDTERTLTETTDQSASADVAIEKHPTEDNLFIVVAHGYTTAGLQQYAIRLASSVFVEGDYDNIPDYDTGIRIVSGGPAFEGSSDVCAVPIGSAGDGAVVKMKVTNPTSPTLERLGLTQAGDIAASRAVAWSGTDIYIVGVDSPNTISTVKAVVYDEEWRLQVGATNFTLESLVSGVSQDTDTQTAAAGISYVTIRKSGTRLYIRVNAQTEQNFVHNLIGPSGTLTVTFLEDPEGSAIEDLMIAYGSAIMASTDLAAHYTRNTPWSKYGNRDIILWQQSNDENERIRILHGDLEEDTRFYRTEEANIQPAEAVGISGSGGLIRSRISDRWDKDTVSDEAITGYPTTSQQKDMSASVQTSETVRWVTYQSATEFIYAGVYLYDGENADERAGRWKHQFISLSGQTNLGLVYCLHASRLDSPYDLLVTARVVISTNVTVVAAVFRYYPDTDTIAKIVDWTQLLTPNAAGSSSENLSLVYLGNNRVGIVTEPVDGTSNVIVGGMRFSGFAIDQIQWSSNISATLKSRSGVDFHHLYACPSERYNTDRFYWMDNVSVIREAEYTSSAATDLGVVGTVVNANGIVMITSEDFLAFDRDATFDIVLTPLKKIGDSLVNGDQVIRTSGAQYSESEVFWLGQTDGFDGPGVLGIMISSYQSSATEHIWTYNTTLYSVFNEKVVTLETSLEVWQSAASGKIGAPIRSVGSDGAILIEFPFGLQASESDGFLQYYIVKRPGVAKSFVGFSQEDPFFSGIEIGVAVRGIYPKHGLTPGLPIYLDPSTNGGVYQIPSPVRVGAALQSGILIEP